MLELHPFNEPTHQNFIICIIVKDLIHSKVSFIDKKNFRLAKENFKTLLMLCLTGDSLVYLHYA
jgi:hypothetical protein